MVEVAINKLNILNDDDYANLKIEETCININTMPHPSSHGHHFQKQAKVIKELEEFLFALEKEMPASEAKMFSILKAKENVIAEFVKAIDHIKDCMKALFQEQMRYFL